MGNRSYLYVTANDSGENTIQLAEANSNLPLLWQLMLAHGQVGTPNRAQRVFDDADTPGFEAPLGEAIERVRAFLQFAKAHPLIKKVKHFARYADACVAYVEALRVEHGDSAYLDANLDELSWLESPPVDVEDFGRYYHEKQQTEFDTVWQQFKRAIDEKNYVAFGEFILRDAAGQSLDDWNLWQWHVGFGGLDHPYFDHLETRQTDFARWNAAQKRKRKDEPKQVLYLTHDCYVVQLGERFGVLHQNPYDTEDSTAHELLPIEHDEITNGDPEGANEMVFIRKGNLWGVSQVLLEGERPRLKQIVPLSLDNVWPFLDGVALAQAGGKFGHIRADGAWLYSQRFDETFDYSNGYATFRDGDKFGYLDSRGHIAIPATFDDARDFIDPNRARVQLEGKWGLIDRTGAQVVPCIWPEIEWRDDLAAWLAKDSEKMALLEADGSVRAEIDADAVEVLIPGVALRLERAERYGVLDWHGKLCWAPRFLNIEDLYDTLRSEEDAQEHRPYLLRASESGQKVGVIALDGVEVVPLQYERIEVLTEHYAQDAQGQTVFAYHPDLLIVARKPPKSRKRLRGLWSVARRAEVLPCSFTAVTYFCVKKGEDGLFLTIAKLADKDAKSADSMRLGILRGDLSVLFPADYAWFGSTPWDAATEMGEMLNMGHIREAWAKGEPVRAAHVNDNAYHWLYSDGRLQTHEQYLMAQIQNNEDIAAYELAKAFRYGEGVPHDAVKAREWMQAAALGKGKMRKEDRNRACYDYADMLFEGDGGDADPVQARAILEKLAKQKPFDSDAGVYLGYMLVNGFGGDPDPKRAVQLYETATRQGNLQAMVNLAGCLETGNGLEVDLSRALALYKQASDAGHRSAAYSAGFVAHTMFGEREPPDSLKDLLEQAEYYYQKYLQSNEEEFRNTTLYNLGLLSLDTCVRPAQFERAEKYFVEVANHGDLDSMRALIVDVYGNPESPRRNSDAEKAWRKRYEDAGGTSESLS